MNRLTQSSDSAYMYMADLQAISEKLPLSPILWHDIPNWSQIVTPMSAMEWDSQLAFHPDESYHEYLVKSLRHGFRIGFNHGSAKCKCVSAESNMSSASERSSVIDEFIATELAAGMWGTSSTKRDMELYQTVHAYLF